MSDEVQINEIVTTNIKRYGIKNGDIESLGRTTKRHLLGIETYLQNHINSLKDLSEKVKKSKLNLLTIADNTDIPRSTIYKNSETLKVYIDQRIAEIEAEDILSLNKMNKRQQEITELREYLDNLEIHLIDNEVLEAKIIELESEIGNLRKMDEAHIAEISRLKIENHQLLNELRKVDKISQKVVNFS